MAEGGDIIIKKIKKGGHAAHGGAWKVAYADFVTAMMAFFLLLWLLNVTTDEQKAGIAEFFTPTVGIKDEKGIGFQGGEKPVQDGEKKDDLTPVGIIFGAPTTGPQVKESEIFQETLFEDEGKPFESAGKHISDLVGKDETLKEFGENIMMIEAPEGMKIEMTDSHNLSMFAPGKAELLPYAKIILARIARIIEMMPYKISVDGHTDSTGFSSGVAYGNWELSADRANASRRYLVESGVLPERIMRVTGKADKELLDPSSKSAPRNRRITIILLRNTDIFTDHPELERVLSVPRVDDSPVLELNPKSKKEESGIPLYPSEVVKPAQKNRRPFATVDPLESKTNRIPQKIEIEQRTNTYTPSTATGVPAAGAR